MGLLDRFRITEYWNNNGVELSNQGKFEKALEYFDKTLIIDPNNAKAWNNKGYAFKELEKI